MYLQVQRDKSIESGFQWWSGAAEMRRNYDVLLTLPIKARMITALWLPFKTINFDNNNIVFRLLIGKFEPHFGYSLSIVEVGASQQFSYPAEAKVIDTIEEPKEDESTSEQLTNYRLKVVQKFKIEESLTNVAYIQHQYNMVLARGADSCISLYDTTQPPDRNDGIEFFERLLKMDGHEHPGFGMDWNPHKEAVAITSSFDGCVCVWDISSATKLDRLVRPVAKFCMPAGNFVPSPDQDVKWHKKDPNLFCCSSKDGDLFLYAD